MLPKDNKMKKYFLFYKFTISLEYSYVQQMNALTVLSSRVKASNETILLPFLKSIIELNWIIVSNKIHVFSAESCFNMCKLKSYLFIFVISKLPQLINVVSSPSFNSSASAPSMYTRGEYQTSFIPTPSFCKYYTI